MDMQLKVLMELLKNNKSKTVTTIAVCVILAVIVFSAYTGV